MIYISIDGDDVGQKITSFYLKNNSKGLTELSQSLQISTKKISSTLEEHGFSVIFCAADGVVASTELAVDLNSIFNEIRTLAAQGLSFSAGAGSSLRESYIALTSAKSNGKNCLHEYSALDSDIEEVESV